MGFVILIPSHWKSSPEKLYLYFLLGKGNSRAQVDGRWSHRPWLHNFICMSMIKSQKTRGSEIKIPFDLITSTAFSQAVGTSSVGMCFPPVSMDRDAFVLPSRFR